MLDALPIQKLNVEDEAEYYQHRDFDKMLREHFHPWLKTMVDVLTGQFSQDHTNVCMCWDLNAYTPEDVPGTVITPVGRFSGGWMREAVENRGIEALAERFFLWYHPGKRDALYNRGWAGRPAPPPPPCAAPARRGWTGTRPPPPTGP